MIERLSDNAAQPGEAQKDAAAGSPGNSGSISTGQAGRVRNELAPQVENAAPLLAGDSKSMLDIHAPSGPAHNWRDFLVHIAAIAIGLLLALGLEKFAEYVHERRQLTVARRELVAEVAANARNLAMNVTEVSRIQQELAVDLKIIQAQRAHAAASGTLDYSVKLYAALDGDWQAVRQSGALDLMPHAELQTYAWFHGILTSLMESMHAVEPILKIDGAIAASAPLDKLSTHELDELADKTVEAQGRLEDLRMFLGFEEEGLKEITGQTWGRYEEGTPSSM